MLVDLDLLADRTVYAIARGEDDSWVAFASLELGAGEQSWELEYSTEPLSDAPEALGRNSYFR